MPVGQQYDYMLGINGYMLAREKDGPRAWKRTGAPDAPRRRQINDVTYGDVPDTLDHPEVWNDWSGGFGDAYEMPDRPNTYHSARGFDLRFPRQAIHAQAPQLLAAAYASVARNAEVFFDVPPASRLTVGANPSTATGLNWTTPENVFVSDDARATNAGVNILLAGGFSLNVLAGATVLGIEVTYEGGMAASIAALDRVVTIGLTKDGEALAGTEKTGRPFGADDGAADVTNIAGSAGDLWGTTWTPAEVNDSAFGTRLNGGIFGPTRRVDLIRMDVHYRVGGAQTPPGGSVLVMGRDFIGALTPTQYQNTAGSAFELRHEATAGGPMFGYRPALFGSFLYIPNIEGSAFLRRGYSDVVYSLGPGMPAQWFGVGAGRLWTSIDGITVRSVAAGANAMATGNYSASLSVGMGARRSRDAVAIDDQLMIGFPDGVYQGNLTGTFSNIMADIGELADDDNCRDLTAFQGGLIAAAGSHLWWYRPSTGGNSELREVGPSGLSSNRSRIRGRFTTVRGFGKWLYAGLFTGSGSYLMVGRDASAPLPYVWHPLHDFLGLTCKVSRIHIDSITRASGGQAIPNRIWCATEASYGSQAGATAPVFYWPIPYGDGNPLSDLTFSPNYMGSARLDMPESDWGAPGASKTWRVNETWSEGLASGAQYADLYYALDQGARATLGRVQQSPKAVTYFPAGVGSFVRGQALALSVDSFTASVNLTPGYRAFVTRGTLMPRSIDTIEARTRIADNMRDRNGGKMRPGATMLRELRGYAGGSAPVLMTDLAGATSWVKVQPPIEEVEFYQQGQENPEVAAMVRASVMEFSAA